MAAFRLEPAQFTAPVALVRSGGIVVNGTAWMPATGDPDRDVRSAIVVIRSNAERLMQLVSLVDHLELQVEIARHIPLSDLPALHVEAAADRISGKSHRHLRPGLTDIRPTATRRRGFRLGVREGRRLGDRCVVTGPPSTRDDGL